MTAIQEDPRLRSCVQLIPACSPDEVWDYLAAADIFAFASHAEGMPNSLLEAMAMEVPVVAFAIPPVVELNGGARAVALCRPFDVEAFAESIRRLSVAEDERRWRGREGRAVVQSRFLVRRNMAVAVERLEEQILAKAKRESGARSEVGAQQAG